MSANKSIKNPKDLALGAVRIYSLGGRRLFRSFPVRIRRFGRIENVVEAQP